MNTKTTLVVLALAVILGLAALYKFKSTDFNSASDTNAAKARLEGTDPDAVGTPLFAAGTFKPETITHITLTKADGSRFVFEKNTDPAAASSASASQSDWRQTEPIPYRMTGWSIREIANRTGDLMYSDSIKEKDLRDDLAPANLGFEPPLATIELTAKPQAEGAAPTTVIIQLGKTHLAGRGFVRLGSTGPVYVTGSALHEHVLNKNPKEWRDKKVFPFQATDISRLSVDSTDPDNRTRFALARIQGDWHVTEPVSIHANTSRLSSLTSSLANARLRGFVEDNPADLAPFGLDTPGMRAVAKIDRVAADGSVNTEKYELVIGHRINLTDDLWYAMRAAGGSPDVFTLPKTTIDSLRPDPDILVGQSVLTAKPQDIKGLTIDNGSDNPFKIERTADGWTITVGDSGTPAPAVAPAVDQILTAITQAHDTVELDIDHTLATSMPVLARIGVITFASDNTQQTVIIGTRLKEDTDNLFQPENEQQPSPTPPRTEYLYTLDRSGVIWVSATVPGFQLTDLAAPVTPTDTPPQQPDSDPDAADPMK